jgi:hypothetical protein
VDLHPCLEVHQAQPDTRRSLYGPGPYPLMTRAEMRESLELLPSWVLAQKAAANRQVEAAEQLLAERQADGQDR